MTPPEPSPEPIAGLVWAAARRLYPFDGDDVSAKPLAMRSRANLTLCWPSRYTCEGGSIAMWVMRGVTVRPDHHVRQVGDCLAFGDFDRRRCTLNVHLVRDVVTLTEPKKANERGATVLRCVWSMIEHKTHGTRPRARTGRLASSMPLSSPTTSA
jgi:hypothetical protein